MAVAPHRCEVAAVAGAVVAQRRVHVGPRVTTVIRQGWVAVRRERARDDLEQANPGGLPGPVDVNDLLSDSRITTRFGLNLL